MGVFWLKSRIPKAKNTRNSRIFVIASEAKQSLGILNLLLGNSKFILRNSKFILGILDFCSLLG